MESLRLSLSSVTLNNDVQIIVDNKELKCSKQLLLQHSKYFEAYFSFSPSPEDHQVVKLKGGIDYETIKTILEGLAQDPKGKESSNIHHVIIANFCHALLDSRIKTSQPLKTIERSSICLKSNNY